MFSTFVICFAMISLWVIWFDLFLFRFLLLWTFPPFLLPDPGPGLSPINLWRWWWRWWQWWQWWWWWWWWFHSTVCLPCNMAFTTRRPIACLCFCQKSSKTFYFGDALLASSTLMLPLLIVMVIMTTSMKKMMRTMKTMMRVLYVPNDDDDGEYVTIIMLMTMMMTTMTMLCVPYMGECTAEPVTTSLLSHISRSLPTALVITSRLSSDCWSCSDVWGNFSGSFCS